MLMEETEEDKPSPDAVWSVIGGVNKNYVRKEEEKREEKEKVKWYLCTHQYLLYYLQ